MRDDATGPRAPSPAQAGGLEIAAEHATTRVPVADPDQRAGELRGELLGREFDSVDDVVVLDRGRLVGMLAIERLLAAAPETPIGELMDADPPVVTAGTDQERAAWAMVQRGESSLAIVDARNRFVGLVPPERMLSVLLAEHDEDMARLGGYMAGATQARGAAVETVMRRLWHRLPWLLLGLVGGMLATVIVGGFERELDANVLVAFFIPAIVYMAGAVATQTETVLVRALSVGVTVRAILARELLGGLIMGAIIGAVFLAFALIGWGDEEVAIAVGVAMLASCSVATVVAMALPWVFHRLGSDPAFGSGPLATVVQDLLSIVIYFAVVAAIVS